MLTKKAFTDKSSLFAQVVSKLYSHFFGPKNSTPAVRLIHPPDYPPARQILGLLLALGITVISAQAQSFQGALRGGVKDKEGQMLAGATLTLTNQATNVSRTTVVQNAWERGQELAVHGWIYDLKDGLLRALQESVTHV